jgi:hypothetical protein
MSVWIYVDTNKPEGDVDRLRCLPLRMMQRTWFKINDPEGEAFDYEVAT